MSVQAFDLRKVPTPVRRALSAILGESATATEADASALEVLQDTKAHVNPRQAALFHSIDAHLRAIASGGAYDPISLARTARERLAQLFELEQLEDERTYGEGGALGYITASHAADLAIVARSESVLAERRS